MNNESYLETMRQQYTEEIHAALVAHSHDGDKVDYPALNKQLQKLMGNARIEGLPAHEFEELARATLPAEVAQKVVLGKKAA